MKYSKKEFYLKAEKYLELPEETKDKKSLCEHLEIPECELEQYRQIDDVWAKIILYAEHQISVFNYMAHHRFGELKGIFTPDTLCTKFENSIYSNKG